MLEGKMEYYQSDEQVKALYADGWRIAHTVFDPTAGYVLFICERQPASIDETTAKRLAELEARIEQLGMH